MRIEHSSLQTEGMALAWKHSRQSTSIDISVTRNARDVANDASLTDLSAKGLAAQQSETVEASEESGVDSRLRLLIAVIEAMTGRKLDIFDPASLQGNAKAPPDSETTEAPPSRTQPPPLTWSVRIEQSQLREEFEFAAFSARGQVSTADGRRIDFSLDMLLQRYEREESNLLIEAGNQPKATDPLVLNLASDQVRLRAGEYSFDLNTDGQTDKLALLESGSAYLALDRNGNARIDDGGELFGPQSGNGFNELALLDDDGNGWIDENDAAFTQLSLWRPGEGLQTLAEANVGAIALQHRSTPFSLKQGDEVLGMVRSSGVFLSEDGQARSIQQIDLVI